MKRGLVLIPFLAGACTNPEPGDPFVPDTDADWTPGPPVARCTTDGEPVQPQAGEAHVSGAESHDPLTPSELSYGWSIASAPPGGVSALEGDTSDELTFFPNVAGIWVAQLVVSNGEGVVSAPCSAAVSVVPDQRLWVELSWNNTNDDLNLHLLQNHALYGSNGDCYAGNCTPIGTSSQLSWGAAGSTDDPILLASSFDKGPEITAIVDPASGTYEIAVDDAPNSDPGDTEARVRVFVDGEEVYSDQRTLRGEPTNEGALVWFAKVQFPMGTVTTCSPSGC